MIVDTHTHVWAAPQEMGPAIQRCLRARGSAPWERPDASAAAHRRAMEPAQVALVHGLRSAHGGATVTHQHVAATVAQQPEKYLGLAGIDPIASPIDASLDEALELGLVGVTICPAGQDMHPCHSRAMRLYERCEAEGLPLYVHGRQLFGDRAVMAHARPDHYDEIARAFPSLRIALAEMGHPWLEATIELLCAHANVYADISGLVAQPWRLYNALLAAHHAGATAKLLFGSGFPFANPRDAILNVYSINQFTQGTHLPTVPRSELQRIVEADALASLGLQPPHGAADAPQEAEATVAQEGAA